MPKPTFEPDKMVCPVCELPDPSRNPYCSCREGEIKHAALPQVDATIRELIALRNQVIEDVYEITGLSNIMLGVTDATETLGAQSPRAEIESKVSTNPNPGQS